MREADQVETILSALRSNQEDYLWLALRDLVQRGILIIEKEPLKSCLEPDFDGYTYKISEPIRLVVRDMEYIEKLESRITYLEGMLSNIAEMTIGFVGDGG